MAKLITITSGKGGVGKTTTAINLGAALNAFGKDVIILDANLTTPNVGLHLGAPIVPVSLNHVLLGKAKIVDAIYEHESGVKIIPAGLSLRDLRGTDSRDLPNAMLDLLGVNDIVILDAAAGLGKEALAAMESADEVLIVTTPELPAVTDALKAIKLGEQLGAKIAGVVVNKVSGKSHEMKIHEVEEMLGKDVIAVIPEDRKVHESVAKRTPVVMYAPNSKASKAINKLAANLVGHQYKEKKRGFFFR